MQQLNAFVVEDNPHIRENLVGALEELTCVRVVGSSATEDESLAWLQGRAPEWDIAIVDLVLEPRGGTGFGVLQSLRDRPATKKVVVLTATANAEVRRRCEAMGADGVFDKAMETEALLDYCVKLARAAGGH